MSNLLRVALAMVAAVSIGCGSTPAKTSQLSNTTATPKGPTSSSALFTIGIDSLGPITAKTPATLTALRELLGGGGYEVKPVNNSGEELHVFLGDELLFYVIPNDDGSLFNVHAPSSKVDIAQHPQWKIGSPFTDPELLTTCECWGTNPVCFKKGDHVAVGFARPGCNDEQYSEPRLRQVLDGVTIQRAVWSPTPFGHDEPIADPCGDVPGSVIPAGADPCGGP